MVKKVFLKKWQHVIEKLLKVSVSLILRETFRLKSHLPRQSLY
ncbi:unnamed protein product [Paramecium sonneborni]|uniref:Uncharacterized protein n=1 Tax=Paramecium sonneborni TaxID=65129 RepID=A0A8S1RST3_9CILI|nr:unnamed protein product [Paramecium sonneborni]